MANDQRRGTGALTGATGSLTPDDLDEPFVPAEQREITDPRHAGEVSASAQRRATQRHAAPNEAGALNGEDERPETVEVPAPAPQRGGREPRLGGDVRQDPTKEHM